MEHSGSIRWLSFILLWLGLCVIRADERIMVEGAKVNGTPMKLAFDTGANDIYLFSSAVERLKLKVAPVRNLLFQKIGTATVKAKIEFWGESRKQRIPVVDSPPFDCGCDDLDGVIGWYHVWDNTLVFDTLSNTVRLAHEVPAEAKQWTKLKLTWDSILIMKVSDGAKTGRVEIDTGSASGLGLSPARWREWKAAHPEQPTTFHGAYMPGLKAIIAQEQAWASDFTLGPLKFSDVILEESDPLSASYVGKKHAATLGLAALKRLDLVIDGGHDVAYLRAKSTPPTSTQHNRLGATFTPRDLESDALIAHVASGSPAYEAGIRNGDELVKIGERDITQWRKMTNSFGSVWELPAGTRVELTLHRSNGTFRTTATLRDILPPKRHEL